MLWDVWLFVVDRGTCSRGCALMRTAPCALAAPPLWAAFFGLRRASLAQKHWERNLVEGNIRVRAADASPAVFAVAETLEGVLSARGERVSYLAGRTGAAVTDHIYTALLCKRCGLRYAAGSTRASERTSVSVSARSDNR